MVYPITVNMLLCTGTESQIEMKVLSKATGRSYCSRRDSTASCLENGAACPRQKLDHLLRLNLWNKATSGKIGIDSVNVPESAMCDIISRRCTDAESFLNA